MIMMMMRCATTFGHVGMARSSSARACWNVSAREWIFTCPVWCLASPANSDAHIREKNHWRWSVVKNAPIFLCLFLSLDDTLWLIIWQSFLDNYWLSAHIERAISHVWMECVCRAAKSVGLERTKKKLLRFSILYSRSIESDLVVRHLGKRLQMSLCFAVA